MVFPPTGDCSAEFNSHRDEYHHNYSSRSTDTDNKAGLKSSPIHVIQPVMMATY